MKKLACWTTLVLLIFATLSQAETLRFAPLPMESRETVVKQFLPMTTYLEQRLSIRIVFEYFDNYADILAKFGRSELELAFLGPLPYVELRRGVAAAEPLVHFREKSGEANYTCAVVSFPDNGFDIHAAVNRKIALTQPLSTCGYLSTSGLMRRNGSSLERNLFRYLGQHDAVALSVVEGEFEAGGLKTAIARKYSHLGLKIIAETPPLPAFALVANKALIPGELMARIRNELTLLEPQGKDKILLEAWGDNIRYGAVSATDGDYQAVRELLSDVPIPMVGNY